MEYTVKIFRIDRRCKTGDRFLNSYDFDRPDDAAMEREVLAIRKAGYPEDKFRITYAPKYITVINMMSGKEVQILADTPWSCRPDSESYWSS